MNKPQIYIARALKPGCSWLKIGASRDPETRMKSVHSPDNLGAELVRVFDPQSFWRSVERGAHARLRHREHWREWFDVSFTEATWAIYAADKEWREWSRRASRPTDELMSLPFMKRRYEITRSDGISYFLDSRLSEDNLKAWPIH